MQKNSSKSTKTYSFGVSKRESHDSSLSYSRFCKPCLSDDSLVCKPNVVNSIFCKDARSMDEINDNCVGLIVTSPPYFSGKEYEIDLTNSKIPPNYIQYLQMLYDVFRECVRTLESGGKIAVNVANLGRKPYRSLSSDVISILQNDLGLLIRGEIIWQKSVGSNGNCAWGSFAKATNPVLRDTTERIIIASKGRFDRALDLKQRKKYDLPYKSTISKEEFMQSTLDVWNIPPQRATLVKHPAPFPVDLPKRLINLYTFENDLVLDPFMGSGTTAIAALQTNRKYIGYETEQKYCDISAERISLHLTNI